MTAVTPWLLGALVLVVIGLCAAVEGYLEQRRHDRAAEPLHRSPQPPTAPARATYWGRRNA